jgi:hypothetical protein
MSYAASDHVLCFQCYRSQVNRQRAQRFAVSPFGRVLSARELEHRRLMLAHLTARSRMSLQSTLLPRSCDASRRRHT